MLKNLIFATLLFYIPFQTFQTARIFFTKQNIFRYTHGYVYYLNSLAYKKYSGDFDNFVISNRYGDSQKAFSFYTKGANNNASFKQFNNDEMEYDTIYIGLSEEFETTGKKGGNRVNFELMEKYPLWDPPVSEYGNELWVGYKK